MNKKVYKIKLIYDSLYNEFKLVYQCHPRDVPFVLASWDEDELVSKLLNELGITPEDLMKR